jgi:hypothetical protein
LAKKILFLTYIQDPDPPSFEKLDPDPDSPKKLDSDPHKVNADPKHFHSLMLNSNISYIEIVPARMGCHEIQFLGLKR